MKDFTKMIEHYRKNVRLSNETAWDVIDCFMENIINNKVIDDKKLICIAKDIHEIVYGKHFDEFLAKYQVSKMFYVDNEGNKLSKEAFSYAEAKKVYDKIVKNIDDSTVWDVYVALNAQYNDNIMLYKEWFKESSEEEIKNKIVKSAITNWFEDVDATSHKVWNYFRIG